MVHLLHAGRKLRLAAAVDNHRLGTQTLGRAHGVHRHIAAADDHHLAAHVDGRVVTLVVGVHEVRTREELVGRDHAVEVLARNAHEARQTGARTDEHGVVTLAVQQIVHGHRASHDHVGLDLHAQGLHGLDLAGHDPLLGQAELGDAVYEHAAHLVQRLEDLHLVAHLRQVARAGQAARAAAHDGDLAAVARRNGSRGTAVLQLPVAHEALQLADGHRLALDAQHARTFALALLGTYAAADARQRAVLGDDRGRTGHVAGHHLLDEVGNADVHRTGRGAAGIFAMQAARRLKLRLLKIVAVAHLLEVGRTDRGVLFAHGYARYFVCHTLFFLICPNLFCICGPRHARPRWPRHAAPGCGTCPGAASPRRNRPRGHRTRGRPRT